MTDRKLLEMAAKAAGVELYWSRCGNPEIYDEDYEGRWIWNPLTDDDDALRLAVNLGIDVWRGTWPSGYKYVSAYRKWCNNESRYIDDGHILLPDPCAATRRAIVRAAAEIGKSMA